MGPVWLPALGLDRGERCNGVITQERKEKERVDEDVEEGREMRRERHLTDPRTSVLFI